MSNESSWVVSATDETFNAEVMERSHQGLVIVDFWAEWCAPCRMLGPVLEKLASDFNGKFTLVKAETEVNSKAAGEFSVAGIPAVFAVSRGEVIDRFEGALPEETIREWLEQIDDHLALQDALILLETNREEGLVKVQAMLDQIDRDEVLIEVGKVLLEQQCITEVEQIVAKLESRGFLEVEAEQLKSALSLKGHASIDPASLRLKVDSNPDDLDAKLSLAKSLVGARDYAVAFDLCLELVERDRLSTGEEARELMVDVFKALPADSDLVADYRRKLSMLLF